MNNLKLNICIPYHNSSRYFSEALESIVNQTYTNWEIFIYNDGSTLEETQRLEDSLAQYTNKYCIIGSEKIGIYRARIKLLENVNNGYVLFLDSDDYYADSNVFETIASKIKQTNSDIIYFNYLKCCNSSKKDICLFKKKYTKTEIDQQFLINNNLNSIWNKVFNAKLLKSLKFDDKHEFSFAEDRLIGALLHSKAHSISYINKSLYCYRVNRDSLSNSAIDKSRIYSQINVEDIISRQKFALACKSYNKNLYITEHILYPSLWYTTIICNARSERFLLYKDILSIVNREKLHINNKLVNNLHRRIAVAFLTKGYFRLLDLYLNLLVIIKGQKC